VLKFCFFSYNLFISRPIYFILTHTVALVKTFTLICHIVTFKFICVEKLGEKYKNPALMWDPHFLLFIFWTNLFIYKTI